MKSLKNYSELGGQIATADSTTQALLVVAEALFSISHSLDIMTKLLSTCNAATEEVDGALGGRE